ncbi:MAG: single-stranded DNA-binding protein [Planctomycetales bacterium]|nr:single-stranded DNA-binding protein [Planctomycetales bacterium]
MANLNKVLLMGNMTRDPQLTYLPSQTPVVEFGLAINRKYKKQDGTMAEDTCYVDCRMFGKRAETVNKYFKKGDPIFVEGRLQYDAWEKDGKKQSRLRVFVENFEFLGKGGGHGGAGGGPAAPAGAESGPDVSYGSGGPDDDIPF